MFVECVKFKGVIVVNVELMWLILKFNKVDVKKKLLLKVKFKGWGFFYSSSVL